MAISSNFTKEVQSSLSLPTETTSTVTIYGGVDNGTVTKSLVFTLCNRTDSTDKKGNYFSSFNLPYEEDQLPTGSTLSLSFPELQQLNVDKIVTSPIPAENYSEFIDGRSLTFKVPQNGGASQTSMSSITLYSSTYTSEKNLKSESNPLLGDNVVFLFSDDINIPYTGFTVGDNGNIIDHSSNTTWEPDLIDFTQRPAAVSYSEIDSQYNTDKRTNAFFAKSVPSNYPDNRDGYNYDIPVGFAVLDKGFVVLTHTGITENIPWTSGFTASDDLAYTGTTDDDKTNIYFTGTSSSVVSSSLSFENIDTSFKTSVVCIAMPQEFFISNNSTWDSSKVTDQTSGFIDYDPVQVTEVGLYNDLGELIAVAKFSEPIEKIFSNVLTFNLDIEI